MIDKPERRRLPPPWVARMRLNGVVHLRFIRLASSCVVSISQGGFTMSEEIEPQVTRRKLFLLVGLAASFAVPVAVLTTSNAEAQQPDQQPAAPPPKKKKKQKPAPTGTVPTPSEKPKAQ
jgi:hypothetical protein